MEPATGPGTRVVFVGTVYPKLDVEAIVESARLGSVDELVVIGDGAMYGELVQAKRDRDLDTLSLPGYLSTAGTWSLVAGADVAINPQTQSPTQAVSSPVKLCYYRALGVPMVLSDGLDLAREFAEAGVARLVSPGDGFAETLDGLLTDGDALETMRSRATQTGGYASWTERAQTLQQVYGPPS